MSSTFPNTCMGLWILVESPMCRVLTTSQGYGIARVGSSQPNGSKQRLRYDGAAIYGAPFHVGSAVACPKLELRFKATRRAPQYPLGVRVSIPHMPSVYVVQYRTSTITTMWLVKTCVWGKERGTPMPIR
jgi:hypothetical protein